MDAPLSPAGKGRAAGFSLIELLVVVAIISVLAAISVPQIARYIRNYEIMASTQQVVSELQTIRTRAIMKNAPRAPFLVAVDNVSYRWVMPDQQFLPIGSPLKAAGGYRTLGELLADPNQLGPLQTLPTRLQFDPTGATTSVVAFNRLGGQCDATASVCSNPVADLTGGPAVNYVAFNAATGQATLTVVQDQTGLTRRVVVEAGGRIQAQVQP